MGETSRTALIAGLAVIAAIAAPAAAQADCKLTVLAEFHLDPASAVPVVDGQINGQPVKILIDTGVTESRVARAAAVSLGVTMTPRSFSNGDRSSVFDGRIRELRIGAMTNTNVEMGVSDEAGAPPGVALVLGDDFLSRTDLEFDLAHGVVRMFDAQGCAPPQLVYWGQPYSQAPLVAWTADAPAARVEAAVDGTPVLARLDTGAPASSIDAAAASLVGASGGPASFALGDERINGARLGVADIPLAYAPTTADLARGEGGVPLVRIGADFFRAHRVFIDVRDRLVLFSYEGGPVFASDASAPR